ncbi:MAG: tRNA-dihydrouridine synthase [Candidatus Nomurabacteria bacterium]|nr:tRNA-dihydrouridine synthase [Candidatus Nomurabacteria bacterium]USN87721.1 MAG: tRNA-dihydrouridine synthase [Candidatus Nomurabacteria bacterium]
MVKQTSMNFWEKLPKPFYILAPMADVTDAPFRRVIAKYSAHKRADGTDGGPDVTFTEFVSADGLARATPEGKKKLMADLIYTDTERPIVAQLFTSNEEHMEAAARLCRELGFDGVDINMGCPDRSIEKQGCGSAMIKNPEVAKKIIRAAKRGAKMGEIDGIPVSVKTRLGYNRDQLEEWLPVILEEKPATIILHGRTRKEMSKVPARWERIKRAVELRDELQKGLEHKTLIVGNGDALSLEDARQKAELSDADGVMLGRAVFGNPWLFHPEKDASNVPIEEKLRVMVEHSELFAGLLPFKNFSIMKKHYKAYVKDFPGAHELRNKLMEQNTAGEVKEVVGDFLLTR